MRRLLGLGLLLQAPLFGASYGPIDLDVWQSYLADNPIDLESCFADLAAADVDSSGGIDMIEYQGFIQAIGTRKCTPVGELTLQQRAAFTSLACQCRETTGDAACCLNGNARLDTTNATNPALRTDRQTLLLAVTCVVSDAAIVDNCVSDDGGDDGSNAADDGSGTDNDDPMVEPQDDYFDRDVRLDGNDDDDGLDIAWWIWIFVGVGALALCCLGVSNGRQSVARGASVDAADKSMSEAADDEKEEKEPPSSVMEIMESDQESTERFEEEVEDALEEVAALGVFQDTESEDEGDGDGHQTRVFTNIGAPPRDSDKSSPKEGQIQIIGVVDDVIDQQYRSGDEMDLSAVEEGRGSSREEDGSSSDDSFPSNQHGARDISIHRYSQRSSGSTPSSESDMNDSSDRPSFDGSESQREEEAATTYEEAPGIHAKQLRVEEESAELGASTRSLPTGESEELNTSAQSLQIEAPDPVGSMSHDDYPESVSNREESASKLDDSMTGLFDWIVASTDGGSLNKESSRSSPTPTASPPPSNDVTVGAADAVVEQPAPLSRSTRAEEVKTEYKEAEPSADQPLKTEKHDDDTHEESVSTARGEVAVEGDNVDLSFDWILDSLKSEF